MLLKKKKKKKVFIAKQVFMIFCSVEHKIVLKNSYQTCCVSKSNAKLM